MGASRMKIGKWEFGVGIQKEIERSVVEKLEEFLNYSWRKTVIEGVKKPWWSITHLGIPSPIVRVDMAPVINQENDVRQFIYEIEERPAGLGTILSLLSRERIGQWKKILISCECKGFINIDTSTQDDKLAAEILGIPYYTEVPKELLGPYWIRSDQTSGEIVELESVSLVPIETKGDKTYLLTLGMAKPLVIEELDWSQPFVVKPLIGSKTRGVEIYVPNFLEKEFGVEGSTKTRILRVVNSSQVPYIVQIFIPPLKEEIGGKKGCTIWRLFFGWEVSSFEYQFIGGVWNWRPSFKVHGATDAVFGILEEKQFLSFTAKNSF